MNGLLSLSIANIILHTLCETAPIATSFGFESHFLEVVLTKNWIFSFSITGDTDAL